MKHSELRRQPRHVNPRIQDKKEPFVVVINGSFFEILTEEKKSIYYENICKKFSGYRG